MAAGSGRRGSRHLRSRRTLREIYGGARLEFGEQRQRLVAHLGRGVGNSGFACTGGLEGGGNAGYSGGLTKSSVFGMIAGESIARALGRPVA